MCLNVAKQTKLSVPRDKVTPLNSRLESLTAPVAGATFWSPDLWVSTIAEPIHLSHPQRPWLSLVSGPLATLLIPWHTLPL